MSEPIPPIEREVEVPVSAATAWAALTDPERVAAWFTDAIPLGAVGDEYRLDFGDGSVIEGVIEALEPGRRSGISWRWAGAPPTEVTHVAGPWTVRPTATASTIRLVHDGWAEAGLDALRPRRPRRLLGGLSRGPGGRPARGRLSGLGPPAPATRSPPARARLTLR